MTKYFVDMKKKCRKVKRHQSLASNKNFYNVYKYQKAIQFYINIGSKMTDMQN